MIRPRIRRLAHLLGAPFMWWRRPGRPRSPLPARHAFLPAVEALGPRIVPTISFGGANTFAVGTTPVASTLADLNGDGRLDLVVVNSASNSISVLLNTTPVGSSTPTFAAQQTFAVGNGPFSVAVADFNGDGRPDLAVANFNANSVSVLLNTTPNGATSVSFAAQQTFAVGGLPQAVAVGDFNGDGKPDLAVANGNTNSVSVLLNTTSNGASSVSFAAQQTFAVGTNPISLAAADFNGDGKPDLAVSNFGSNSVSVLLNQTAAGASSVSFAAQQTFAVGGSPMPLLALDLNGDGRPDLAVANSTANTVSILTNTTTAGAASVSFAAQRTFAVVGNPEGLAAGDFEGDGKSDLAVANFSDNTVSVLSNTGGGFDQFVQTFAAGTAPSALAVGDLNGDGRPDLVAANKGSATVTALLNTTSSLLTTNPTVVAQFAAQGAAQGLTYVAQLNRSNNSFHGSSGYAYASLIAANAQGIIAAEFPNSGPSYSGVWLFMAGPPGTGGWTRINGIDATALAIDPLGNVAASFPGFGVGEYRPTKGWILLTGANASLLAMDGYGDVAGAFPGHGVWEFLPSSGWQQINGIDATSLAMNGAGQVAANFPGFGVGLFLPGSGWQLINGHQGAALAIDSHGDVAAQFAGVGVAEYIFSASGWRVLTGANAAQLGMDAEGDVFGLFPGNGVWEFDASRGWVQLSTSEASLLSVA